MAPIKKKRRKKANPVAKLARKTIGLMVRVGDALEAAAAAAEPGLAPFAEPAPAPSADPESTPVPTANAVLRMELAPDGAPVPGPSAPVENRAVAVHEVVAVAPAAASDPVDLGALALLAIEGYATRHNLRAADMPSRGVLVNALTLAMVRHGAPFPEELVRSLLDEQMRAHLRALGERLGERVPP